MQQQDEGSRPLVSRKSARPGVNSSKQGRLIETGGIGGHLAQINYIRDDFKFIDIHPWRLEHRRLIVWSHIEYPKILPNTKFKLIVNAISKQK